MVLRYLAVASALLVSSATAFNNVIYNNNNKVRTTQLYAGPGYKIGAKTEGVLINNRYVVDELAKAVPDGTDMSEIALLRFALGEYLFCFFVHIIYHNHCISSQSMLLHNII